MDKYKPFTYEKALTEALKDREFEKEYNALESEYRLISQLIEWRVKRKLSQKKLAELVGTKQSAISRLESGSSNPSIGFLEKVAKGLGGKLQISITG